MPMSIQFIWFPWEVVHETGNWASLVAQLVKNLPAINAGDLGLIPGLGNNNFTNHFYCAPQKGKWVHCASLND